MQKYTTNVIINRDFKEAGDYDVQYVGKIDKTMFSKITDDISGDLVIITSERIAHCNKHNGAFAKYGKYAAKVISDPDFILQDKMPNTAVLFREIHDEAGKTMQLVLRLHVSKDNPDYQNSIISYWDISEARRKNYERNGKIIYKRTAK